MEKFNSNKHSDYAKQLPFSYFSSNIYLDFVAHTFERNSEHLIVQQDMLFPNDFPSIFLPINEKNHEKCSVTFSTEENREIIKKENIPIIVENPTGTEFFYKTEDFINPSGGLKTKINRFIKSYSFTQKNSYDKEKILDFYSFWKNQRKHESFTFEESEEFFMFCLDNLEKYNIKQVYVEIDEKLAGLAWGVNFRDNWVGLHLKVDYQYRGLSRFLYSERAKLFKDCKIFTLGTGAHDPGIENYKEELRPFKKINYSYILTSSKI